MRRIFGSAIITLVAASALSSHDGFLRRRNSHLLPVPYSPSRHPFQDGHFYLQLSHSGYNASEYYRNVIHTEWNTRGWTFQEGMASQCILYFGPTMFYYRCQREIRAENSQAISQPDRYGISWNYDLWNSIGSGAWFEVVRNYSRRKLTYPLDKLPALSALAHDVEKKTHSQYLAGIWRENLVWSLLWSCIDPESEDHHGDIETDIKPIRSSVYREPSWSWASGDGAIGWNLVHQPK